MQNLFPNGSWSPTGGALGQGSKFSAWTSTVITGTALVSTYSATSGPDATPGVALSCTGTAATLSIVSRSINVPTEAMLGLSVIAKASSTSPTIVPFSVAYLDIAGNAIVTHVPIASAVPTSTSAIQYSAVSGVPLGAVTAVFTFAALTWAATGGYTLTVSSPQVVAF